MINQPYLRISFKIKIFRVRKENFLKNDYY
jgi:hypothetical protein